jgi:5-(carboxyamino)imidazole ribonucleotide synthase
MSDPLPPGSTIGILGGGQLGRMLAVAAAELGLRCHIFCPDPDSPAFDVSAARTIAGYDDAKALERFAGSVDAITYEFENVDLGAAERLAAARPLRPGARALEVSQDRLSEKRFLEQNGIPVGGYRPVDDAAGLERALTELGAPAILKTRRFGYDGKGQVRVEADSDAGEALAAIGNAPAVLEAFVPFRCEVSVIGVRDVGGTCASYSVTENVHRDHILATSTVPASVDAGTEAAAREIAVTIMNALDYVGVMGIEFFVVAGSGGESLLVNEIAPRVHNSGHWTQDGCAVSQFENHIRAVAGWPLGPTERHADMVMTNLVGADAEDWSSLAADPRARLHLYGKREIRPGRKMGHVNRVTG